MKKIYKNFITEEEADNLIDYRRRGKIINQNNRIIDKITRKLQEDFDFNIKEESYYRIERLPTGHKWHIDKGNNGHMDWCDVGVSILLQEPKSGGDTYYADNVNGDNRVKSNRKLYDLIAHTSDEYHMVKPHRGKRIVFLMFV